MNQVIEIRAKSASLKAASQLAGKAQIQSIWLAECRADLQGDRAELDGQSVATAFNIETLPHEFFEPHSLRLKVRLSLDIARAVTDSGCDLPKNEQPKTLGTLMLLFVIEYQLPEGEIPAEIKAVSIPEFAKLNGPYHAWPYMRAEVQHLTAAMGLQPLVLPVLVIRSEETAATVGSAPKSVPPPSGKVKAKAAGQRDAKHSGRRVPRPRKGRDAAD